MTQLPTLEMVTLPLALRLVADSRCGREAITQAVLMVQPAGAALAGTALLLAAGLPGAVAVSTRTLPRHRSPLGGILVAISGFSGAAGMCKDLRCCRRGFARG